MCSSVLTKATSFFLRHNRHIENFRSSGVDKERIDKSGQPNYRSGLCRGNDRDITSACAPRS